MVDDGNEERVEYGNNQLVTEKAKERVVSFDYLDVSEVRNLIRAKKHVLLARMTDQIKATEK